MQPFHLSQQTFVGNKRPLELPTPEGDILRITPLGAGSEVGRSCIILSFKEKTIMLDCGVHPGRPGIGGLPFFDEIEPEEIDILLISHFHLDHCAALPYFMEKTNFNGRVFMTHPTKPIYKMILSDYVKVSNIAIDELLYDENDIDRTMDKIEPINYHQQIEVNGVRFWCYNAGHVLGAAMFMIEIAGVHILYTGDYSRQETRHLMAAEIPKLQPDILIVESTYGNHNHESITERESRFTDFVTRTVTSGGRCLIPVFALGSAQELLLILEEHWRNNSRLRDIPIYYASALAAKCMNVYQTYINMMNESIIERNKISNPFDFQHIAYLKGIEHFKDTGPSVVMASPGMLQSGLSRELFEKWCVDEKNCVIIPGYCVDGTLAKAIMNNPSTIPTMDGDTLPLRMTVEYISFSAHSDYQQTLEFVDILQPPHIVLVHGASDEMSKLKLGLEKHFREQNRPCSIWNPQNTVTVEIEFKGEKPAMVIGSLAEREFKDGDIVSGVLVEKGFKHSIFSSDDIRDYTSLTTTTINQSLRVNYSQKFDSLRICLKSMFDNVEKIEKKDLAGILVSGVVSVLCAHSDYVRIEWDSSPVNDMLADSVVSLILQLQANPSTDALIQNSCCSNSMEKAQTLCCFLKRHYNNVTLDERSKLVKIQIENTMEATIDLKSHEVSCNDEDQKQRITKIFESVRSVTEPL